MKSRPPMITVALGLVGILIISIGLIALGTKESRAFPSAESYLPSGSSAFAELLRESGYTVVIDHYTKPRLKPGDVVVAFVPSAPANHGMISTEADDDQLKATKDVITTFVTNGGKLLSLPVAPDFADESRGLYDAKKPIVYSNQQIAANVTWDQQASEGFYLDGGQQSSATQIWGTVSKAKGDAQFISDLPFVMAKTVGKGEEVNVANGIIATNRFIDRQQNALVLIDSLRALNPGSPRIVFAEASFGNTKDPGLLGMIGPWAEAAWFQLIFLGIIVIYTLGKPFGLPDAERRQERGARELMDAMADTLRRGRMTKLALMTVFNDTNRFLRKLYRGRRDPSRFDLESGGMTDLQRALNKLEAAAEIGAPEDAVAKMIREVERLTREAGTRGAGPY